MQKFKQILACSLFLFSFSAYAREWTMMVYLNGHNNLDEFGWEDINEMERVGSTDRFTVVVQWASLKNKTTQRLLIQKDNSDQIVSTVLEELPRVDMGSPEELETFVSWATQNFPAEKYFLDIWNHGGGWHRIESGIGPKDISWDDESGNSISTEELGVSLNKVSLSLGKKLEILGMDACLMAMAEVASEVSDSVLWMASSQELEPGAGWDYEGFLKGIQDAEELSPLRVGKILTNTYVDSYSNGSQGTSEVTFSVLDLGAMDMLYAGVKKLSDEWTGLKPLALKELKTIVGKTMRFDLPEYIDLGDFLSLVEKSKNKDLKVSSIGQVKSALKQLVVYKRNSQGYSRASGLSIWMPLNPYSFEQYNARYQGLKFESETSWLRVITNMISI